MTMSEENSELEMTVPQAEMERMERDFKSDMEALAGEKNMQRFVDSYEKIFRNLKNSCAAEKRLMKRNEDLNDIIRNNAQRVKSAIQLT